MFEHIPVYPGDPILSLFQDFQRDPEARKVNLSIGLYYDEAGKVPVRPSVRVAASRLADQEIAHTYLPMEGSAAYCHALQQLIFGADSAALKKDALLSVPLSATLRLLKKRRDLTADIDVYTDSLGGSAGNQSFSEQRALALRSALRAAGIAEERLRPHGEGPAAPLASNDTPQGRIENRRIEIVFRRDLLLAPRAARVTQARATAP